MPLETATHISDLVVTNPANSDGLNQADDHMRLIKSVLLTDVGNAMVDKKLAAADGSASVPSIGFSADATTGLYRKSTGNTGIIGRLSGNGAVEVGELCMFLVEPTGLGKGGVGTGHKWLELDGSSWTANNFPDLRDHLGIAVGGTITLPDAKTLGRFPRSRTGSVAANTAQADQVGTHGHTASFAGSPLAGHQHTGSGTTGDDSPDHSHATSLGQNNGVAGGSTFVSYNAYAAPGGSTSTFTNVVSGGASTRHQHAFSFTTSSVSAGTPAGTVTVNNSTTQETRPVALTTVLCIKT